MIRLIALFMGLTVIASAAAWLVDRPGEIIINWQGWRLKTSVKMGILFFCCLLVGVVFGHKLFSRLWQGPHAIKNWRQTARNRKGEAVLFSAMTALAAGEPLEAYKFSRRARKLLSDSKPSLIFAAQAARLAGDGDEATRLCRRILKEPEIKFIGMRGLLIQAVQDGDLPNALQYARQALIMRPGSGWVLGLLLDIQSVLGLWREAQETLENDSYRKIIEKVAWERRKAVLIYLQACDANKDGNTSKALSMAYDSHLLDSGFIPAALLAARLFQINNEISKAVRVIEGCWRKTPHPDLVALYLECHPGDNVQQRLRRVQGLDKLNPGHREGQVALAEVLIHARRWHEARVLVEKALAVREESRLIHLMVLIEDSQGINSGSIYRKKIDSALGNDAWVCEGCRAHTTSWKAHCDNCGLFDSVVWSPNHLTCHSRIDEKSNSKDMASVSSLKIASTPYSHIRPGKTQLEDNSLSSLGHANIYASPLQSLAWKYRE